MLDSMWNIGSLLASLTFNFTVHSFTIGQVVEMKWIAWILLVEESRGYVEYGMNLSNGKTNKCEIGQWEHEKNLKYSGLSAAKGTGDTVCNKTGHFGLSQVWYKVPFAKRWGLDNRLGPWTFSQLFNFFSPHISFTLFLYFQK